MLLIRIAVNLKNPVDGYFVKQAAERHDTQHSDIQNNDTRHISIEFWYAKWLYPESLIFYCYAECHYATCYNAESRSASNLITSNYIFSFFYLSCLFGHDKLVRDPIEQLELDTNTGKQPS